MATKTITFPCGIGDTVWYIQKYNSYNIVFQPQEDIVQMLGISSRGIYIKLHNHHEHNKLYHFGKNVFLTKADADKAYAQLTANNLTTGERL